MSPKSLLAFIVLVLVSAQGAWAQSQTELSPPPMVPVAPPPPMPAPEPGAAPVTGSTAARPGTPPPPSSTPPAYVPGAQPYYGGAQPTFPGYPSSPYGSPLGREKPSPEVGFMVSESLFGMLTSGVVLVLPYLLFSALGLTDNATVGNIILIALMVAAPLSTAQTQVGIANGSAYYRTESWVPVLTGLLGDALVFLTYTYWNHGFSSAPPSLFPATATGAGVPASVEPQIIYLLVAGSVGVPLLQMAAINLFKQPKYGAYAERTEPRKGSVALEMPTPMPVFTQTSTGLSVGFGVSLLRGTF